MNGSFLVISAILLNLIACGLVMRPVPIEPAEKAKQKLKEMENAIKVAQKNNAFERSQCVNTQIKLENEKLEALKAQKVSISFISTSNRVEDFTPNLVCNMKNKNNRVQKQSFKMLFKNLIDYTLFFDSLFMFYVASNFFTMLGLYAPYIFIVDQAISLGIKPKNADILLSAIGYFI